MQNLVVREGETKPLVVVISLLLERSGTVQSMKNKFSVYNEFFKVNVEVGSTNSTVKFNKKYLELM